MDLRVPVTIAWAVFVGVACSTDETNGPEDDPQIPEAFKISSEQPAWSPDGKSIVFTYDARHPDELALGASQLWLYSIESNKVTYLTEGHYASWSPSGDRLVYTIGSALWILNLESNEKRQLSDFEPAFQPRWSPTGEKILFAAWSPSQALWRIDADGSNLQEVGIASSSVDWSPDGARFVCNAGSQFHLLMADFGEPPPDSLIETTPALCAYPRWAPDGSWIVYHRYGGGLPLGLWIVRPDGTDAHELIRGGKGQAGLQMESSSFTSNKIRVSIATLPFGCIQQQQPRPDLCLGSNSPNRFTSHLRRSRAYPTTHGNARQWRANLTRKLRSA